MVVTPPIWSDVSRDLSVALREAALAAAKAARLDSFPDEVRNSVELAIGKHLHDAYTAAEAAIERLIVLVDGGTPQGPRYHRDLLDRAADPIQGLRGPIIGRAAHEGLVPLLAFRHVFRHAYGGFDWLRAAPNVAIAAKAVSLLAADLRTFAEAMGLPRA